jgi:hypothetical protein
MKKFVVLTISLSCFFLTLNESSGQGANNRDYKFDEIDIENSFALLGVEAFKFPLKAEEGKKIHLNYITERYEEGKLVETQNYFERAKAKMPKELVKQYLFSIFPEIPVEEELLRLYGFKKSDNLLYLQPVFQRSILTMPFESDTTKYGDFTFRAMLTDSLAFESKTPMLVCYANHKDKPSKSCPGNAKVADIVNLYGSVIVFYAEPIKEED